MDSNTLLKAILYGLNQVPNKKGLTGAFKTTYEMCSAIEKHLREAEKQIQVLKSSRSVSSVQYISTIKIVIESDPATEDPADTIHAIFTENLQQSGVIVDWAYDKKGGTYAHPTVVPDSFKNKWDEHGTLCILSGRAPE